MKIQLPKFKNTQCVLITACGEIETEDRALQGILSKKAPVIARYSAANESAFLKVGGFGSEENNLHIDCALSSYFRSDRIPESSSDLDKLLELISKFNGDKLSIMALGVFDVQLEELPEQGLIRPLLKEVHTGDMSIKLTGADFEITGAPVEELKWHMRPHGNLLRITLNGDISETIDEQYLLRVYDWIETQFMLFVKGKSEDVGN